jgi:hypothetical protein
MEETYQIVESAIDYAFQGKFILGFYAYLKSSKTKRCDVEQFINSQTAKNINDLVLQLEDYLKGGDKQLREAYGHIPKPQARKIKKYLSGILEDALRYSNDRKPGRRKKQSK